MSEKVLDTTCIMCPLGCSLHIEEKDNVITVTGNTCNRGVEYGKSEIHLPMRVLTSLVKVGNSVASVKTDRPIPKTKIKQAMKEIENLTVTKKAEIDDLVASKITFDIAEGGSLSLKDLLTQYFTISSKDLSS